MPNIQGPLFSLGASGTISDTITYQQNRSRKIARSKPVPTGPTTTPQANARGTLRYLNELWKITDPILRLSWNWVARRGGATGYNLLISENMENLTPEATLATLAGSSVLGQGLRIPTIGAVKFPGGVLITGTIPSLPPGWAFVRRIAIATHNVNPRTTIPTDIGLATSAGPGGLFLVPLLDNTPELVYSMWAEYTKPGGETVYSPSNTDLEP